MPRRTQYFCWVSVGWSLNHSSYVLPSEGLPLKQHIGNGRAKADFELREISREEYERIRQLLQLYRQLFRLVSYRQLEVNQQPAPSAPYLVPSCLFARTAGEWPGAGFS